MPFSGPARAVVFADGISLTSADESAAATLPASQCEIKAADQKSETNASCPTAMMPVIPKGTFKTLRPEGIERRRTGREQPKILTKGAEKNAADLPVIMAAPQLLQQVPNAILLLAVPTAGGDGDAKAAGIPSDADDVRRAGGHNKDAAPEPPAERPSEPEVRSPAETAVALRIGPKPQQMVKPGPALQGMETLVAPDPQPPKTLQATDYRPLAWNPGTSQPPPSETVAGTVASAKPTAPVEPPPVPERPTNAQPLRNLSIEIQQPNLERVEVRLLQQSGELHVAVRATDTELVHAMRQDLPQLVSRIDHDGQRVEGWRPTGTVTPMTPATEVQSGSSDSPGSNPQSQHGGSQPDRDQQNQHRGNLPQWVEEMETTLAGETGESNGITH